MTHQYPEDEFDNLQPVSKKGAHRRPAGPLSQGAAITLVTVLAIVALLLVGGTINIIKRSAGDPETVAEQGAAADATQGDDGKDGDGKDEKSQGGSASSAPTSGESSEPTATGDSDVDKSDIEVGVFNASGKTGAAAKLKSTLENRGWTVTSTGNQSSASKSTTVYYKESSNEEAAQTLAEEIGATETKQSTRFSTDLAVLLCTDLAE
ncbi:LytR C-terminal domain-containing protein [Brevibacterium sp. 50QC2O2]|uniref:LytR C-terminal domain-containing protein n=1 Tax=Brevibacterium TaxID=1696 RepID=UPI00211CD886|nr:MULTISPECIES: LytR C-terminal domain-containing protein [unclassified Brevibacterium]MCQ9369076.1 LytR C-terminal domain-containing protein [Brevibacterium sp. 91QC2O2]MCQ9385052.1 LytR C-terminal domain-containing protein [Brevibacterium sp. 68QC2CO]MCQ9387750.1 LytR C-terminal domain-containing protein [Brevibacterium sp. 50QC2O2]